MKVLVVWDDGHDFGEFEYFSNYSRINAKGIKEEAKLQMIQRYGYNTRNREIKNIYRV